MRAYSATLSSQPSLNRKRGGHRPFGFAEMIAAVAALSPVCAIIGIMLVQILGFAPY